MKKSIYQNKSKCFLAFVLVLILLLETTLLSMPTFAFVSATENYEEKAITKAKIPDFISNEEIESRQITKRLYDMSTIENNDCLESVLTILAGHCMGD